MEKLRLALLAVLEGNEFRVIELVKIPPIFAITTDVDVIGKEIHAMLEDGLVVRAKDGRYSAAVQGATKTTDRQPQLVEREPAKPERVKKIVKVEVECRRGNSVSPKKPVIERLPLKLAIIRRLEDILAEDIAAVVTEIGEDLRRVAAGER